jgi:hypothetical protein
VIEEGEEENGGGGDHMEHCEKLHRLFFCLGSHKSSVFSCEPLIQIKRQFKAIAK